MHFFSDVPDIAVRLGLQRVPGRREWRGTCPACGYLNAFILGERRKGWIAWCASCNYCDRRITHLRDAAPPSAAAVLPDRDQQRSRAGVRAEALWRGADPAPRTAADTYLTRRGLRGLATSPALRFRADTPHPGGGRLPALLAKIEIDDGTLVSLHRTFLARDGSGKAAVTPPRASLGPAWGGAIRLDPAAPALVIAEGIETAASAGRLLGLPAWAAVSAGNLGAGVVLPPEVRSVVIAADADVVGERAARAAAFRWMHEGRCVRIARPAIAGRDFNDIMLETV